MKLLAVSKPVTRNYQFTRCNGFAVLREANEIQSTW